MIPSGDVEPALCIKVTLPDTFNFAMKATWVQRGGLGHSIFKAPKTDDGTKNSARGRLAVIGGELVNDATDIQEQLSALQPVWQDGMWLLRESFDVIRARAMSYLPTE